VSINFKSSSEEAARLLSELIKIDTTNPPGNELPAAELVAEALEEFGLKAEVVESEEGRGNVVARIKGRGEGPSLLLLSHLDVVPADPEKWTFNPFSGEIRDGYVYGRGAIDCKGLVAVEVMVMKLLTEKDVAPKGDIIFAATADEEKGGSKGVGWLLANRPELVRADYVINEGGGVPIRVGDKLIYTVQVAEKGVFWLKLKFSGKPAHASVPWLGDNAIVKMSEAVKRLADYKAPPTIIPVVKVLLETFGNALGRTVVSDLLTNSNFVDLALDILSREEFKTFVYVLRAMVRDTISPTMVKGGLKENIIAPECELTIDCRLLPGHTKEDLMNMLKDVLVGMDFKVETITESVGSESPIDTPLYNVIKQAIEQEVPNSLVAPFMSTGGTDSRYFRIMTNSVCYGFWPKSPESTMERIIPLVHGIDEKISISDLEFAIRTLYRVVSDFMYS